MELCLDSGITEGKRFTRVTVCANSKMLSSGPDVINLVVSYDNSGDISSPMFIHIYLSAQLT